MVKYLKLPYNSQLPDINALTKIGPYSAKAFWKRKSQQIIVTLGNDVNGVNLSYGLQIDGCVLLISRQELLNRQLYCAMNSIGGTVNIYQFLVYSSVSILSAESSVEYNWS